MSNEILDLSSDRREAESGELAQQWEKAQQEHIDNFGAVSHDSEYEWKLFDHHHHLVFSSIPCNDSLPFFDVSGALHSVSSKRAIKSLLTRRRQLEHGDAA